MCKTTNYERNKEQYEKDVIKHDCGYWSVCDDHGCKCAIERNVSGFDNKVYNDMRRELEEQARDYFKY